VVVPNHETHSRWGKIVAVAGVAVSIILMIELLHLGFRKVIPFGLSFGAATLVGASLPDIDHKDSIPRRKLGRLGLYLAPVAVVGLVLVDNPVRDTVVVDAASMVADAVSPVSTSLAEIAVAGILVGGVLFGFLRLLDRLKHRGILHSPVVAFVAGGVFVYLSTTHFGLDGELARMAVLGGGAGLVVGYLTHLWLDEELT
jgi:hypothetical protein